ncbi:MAG TPA: choice-of-anchor B family protein, partial [Gemmatimonadales bacterium]|nr:choice-of-anchor B family protein [Gemmatimonadales bacterium]
DLALVGAPGQDSSAGVVHLFRRDARGTWAAAGTVTSGTDAKGLRFGSTLALDGGTLLVGAPREADFTGAVYAFALDAAGAATAKGKLASRMAARNSGFGQAVALHGGTAMIGAPRSNTFVGAVAIFEYDSAAGQWRERGQLLPFDGGRGQFGAGIAFDATGALVSAPTAANQRGRVYAVSRDAEGEWTAVSKLGLAEPGRPGGIAMADGRAIVGRPGADYGLGAAMVLERDAAGAWQERGRLTGEEFAYEGMTGRERRCDGGKLGVFDCGEVDLASFVPVQQLMGERGAALNDVWGWTDPRTGHEIAIVGREDGTTFVDVANPDRPVVLGNLPRTQGSPGSTWRDMKVYRDHAFIVADGAGEHGMQVFDLTRLRAVRGQPQLFTPDFTYRGIHSAHNLVINEASGFAYTVGNNAGGETCGGGLHMIDIRQPKQPKFAGCFSDPQTGRAGTGYSHDAQCVTYAGPDPDYRGREICIGANETAISVADVTDKAQPKAISRATYPNVGYAHQGWFTEDQRYWLMDDELDELSGTLPGTRTLIWDLSDLDDPVLLKEWYGATRATDHNLYIKGTTMYNSNYVAGLRVVDISDIQNPKEVGYFDTVPEGPNEPGFGGSWSNYPFFRSGILVVTSGRQGVFFLRKREAPVP